MPVQRQARHSSGAQSLVEFALVLPLFLLLLVALADFSRLLFTYVSLTNGARELAHVAAFPKNTSTASVAAFNNYTLVAAPTNSATDQIVVTVADQSCVASQALNQACATGSLTSVTCTLPLQVSCALPTRDAASDGYVQVAVTYTFVFNPLFNSMLAVAARVTVVPFQPVLKTTTQAYIE